MNYIVHDQSNESVNTELDTLILDLHNNDGLVRRRARQRLVDMGQTAVPSLCKALQAPADHTRWEAAKALCEIHAPEAASNLVSRLEDENFSVRWLAAEALIGLGGAALVPLLKALLRRPDSAWLRQGAHHILRALEKARGDALLSPVMKALEGIEPNLEVPIAAEATLRSLDAVR